MAIQNFISGGYYGKLGQTVGQRWKNIRTIRSYVVPKDPKSPSQLAQRGLFSNAVKFSQVANQANYTQTAFDTSTNTLWALRMSAARNAISAGKEELNLIPLYPLNFDCPYFITSVRRSSLSQEGVLSLSVTGKLPTEERFMSVLIVSKDDEFNPETVGICPAIFDPSASAQITIPAPFGSEILVGDKLRFISVDDTDSATDLIGGEQLTLLASDKEQLSFLTTVRETQLLDDGVLVVFSQPYETWETALINAQLTYTASGEQQTLLNEYGTIINSNGYCAIKFTIPYTYAFNKPMLPSGSQILINSVSVENATTIYSAVNVTESCVNANTTVNVNLHLTSDPTSSYMVYMQSPISAPTEKTINLSASVAFARNVSDGGLDSVSKTASLVITPSGATLALQNETDFNYPSFWGCSIEFAAQNVVLNGVTYAFQNETFAYSNLNTEFGELTISDDFILAYALVNGKYKFKPYARVGSYSGTTAIFNVPGSDVSGELEATTSGGVTFSLFVTETAEKSQNGSSGWLYIPLTSQYYGSFDTLPTISTLEQIDTSNWEDVTVTMEVTYNGLTLEQPIVFEAIGELSARVAEESTL